MAAIKKTAKRGRRGRGGGIGGKPSPVDVHVGGRVRLRRIMLGMTQEKLGNAIGITFQQIQKNERGTNRIGSSRLYQLSQVLDVPVSFFFDDMPDAVEGRRSARRPQLAEAEGTAYEVDTLAKRETLELVRAYYRIKSPKVRERIFQLAKTLAKPSGPD